MKYLGFLFAAGWFLLSTAAHSAVVATINGRTITDQELESRFQENVKFFRLKPPTKKEVLEEMIKRELGIQEARRLKLHQDPNVVERMNSVLYQALIEKKLQKEIQKITINNKQVRGYYSKNPEIRTSHIFVPVNPAGGKKAEKEAYTQIKMIRDKHLKKKNASFADVAQRFSEDRSAPMGGDIDYQTKDQLDPNYYQTAVALQTPGRVSKIVRSAFGFHIIKLTAVRKWKDTDKGKFRRLAFEERRQKIIANYLNSLRRKAKVAVFKK